MTDRVWIEMPAVRSETESNRVQPKYPVETKALLIYRAEKVYIAFDEGLVQKEVEQFEDCRRLTTNEAIELEESLPFPIPSENVNHNHAPEKRSVGLGDIVSWLTRKLGIEECSACSSRKRSLNRVAVWGWWRK